MNSAIKKFGLIFAFLIIFSSSITHPRAYLNDLDWNNRLPTLLNGVIYNWFNVEKKLEDNENYVEVIEQRSKTSKTFQNQINPNKFILETGLTPVHYSDSNYSDKLNEINFSPQLIQTNNFDGWQIIQNEWHMKFGKDLMKNQDGWVGFGGLHGSHWFQYRLTNFGIYNDQLGKVQSLYGEPIYNRNNLSQQVYYREFDSNSNKIATELEINWHNLWPNLPNGEIYLKWRANSTGIKEDVVLTKTARDEVEKLLKSDINSQQLIGFFFEVNIDDIPKIYHQDILVNIENGLQIDGEKIEFRDNQDRMIAFLPVDDLIVNNNQIELARQKLTNHFFVDDLGKLILFVGIPISDFNNLPEGDLIYDPTIDPQVGASADDSFQDNSGVNSYGFTNVHVRATTTDYRHSALRFTVSGVDQGYTINDAWIETYFENTSRDDIHADVYAEDIDDAPVFTAAANHISTREAGGTTASYEWNVTGTAVGWYNSGSGSLTSVIQEVVDRVGWSSGNHIAIFLDPTAYSDNKFAWITAYDGVPSNAAKLHIEYTVSGGTPTVSQGHFRWRDDNYGLNTDNGWLATEDNTYSTLAKESNVRLRVEVQNTGDAAANNYLYDLEYASKNGASCGDDETFAEVPTTATTQHFEMINSSQFLDGDSITSSYLTGTGTWANGEGVEYPSNTTSSYSLTNGYYTELEYAIKATSNSTSSSTYCFRLTNNGSSLDSYGNYAQVTIASNTTPASPLTPYVNNTTAQSGQISPVTGLIDHTPAFSAIFDDPDTSDTATYYQVQVGSDTDWGTAEMWDSTQTALTSCNEGSRCEDIIYNGTTLVDGTTYYWRIRFWDNGGLAGNWSSTQQFSMNSVPSISSLVLNGSSDITLTSNTTAPISWTSTVTDSDGYADISTVQGKIYRSGVAGGSSCSVNNLNCYLDSDCSLTSCTGSSCTATCTSNVYFFADATDSTGDYPDEDWRAWVEVVDDNTESSSATTGVGLNEVSTLIALNVDSAINYGSLFVGEDTGATNQQTTVTNTGNIEIDTEVSGSSMCTDYPTCSSSEIVSSNQKYSNSTFTYSTGGSILSGTPTLLDLNIIKSTVGPSNSSAEIYWGLSIPSGISFGNYSGQNTVVAELSI
jgi:hypothetical protein